MYCLKRGLLTPSCLCHIILFICLIPSGVQCWIHPLLLDVSLMPEFLFNSNQMFVVCSWFGWRYLFVPLCICNYSVCTPFYYYCMYLLWAYSRVFYLFLRDTLIVSYGTEAGGNQLGVYNSIYLVNNKDKIVMLDSIQEFGYFTGAVSGLINYLPSTLPIYYAKNILTAYQIFLVT